MTALNSVKAEKITREQVRAEYQAFGDRCIRELGQPEYKNAYIIGGMLQEIVALRNERAELMGKIQNFKLKGVA